MMSDEIKPHYLMHNDFINAKEQFFSNYFEDFEDLLILNSAYRINCTKFITNDKKLLKLGKFNNIDIVST